MAAKFVENEFEKCDRMMEVFFQYQRSLAAAVARLAETDEKNEDIIESTKGSAGLYVLQQVRAFHCTSGQCFSCSRLTYRSGHPKNYFLKTNVYRMKVST